MSIKKTEKQRGKGIKKMPGGKKSVNLTGLRYTAKPKTGEEQIVGVSTTKKSVRDGTRGKKKFHQGKD